MAYNVSIVSNTIKSESVFCRSFRKQIIKILAPAKVHTNVINKKKHDKYYNVSTLS